MGKTIAIMQPYFLPYIGYWQLLGAVDEFVIYDAIQYTKKGWVNRNRFLLNGQDEIFSIPLKKDSDFLDICEREISPAFDREKLVRQLREAYRKAPYFEANFGVIENCIRCPENNLFAYIFHAVRSMADYLGITTPFVVSSTISGHGDLKGQDKVIRICKALGATTYINPIGGVELYDKNTFEREGIDVRFLKTGAVDYSQFGNPFIPHLSIVDVLMFNSIETLKEKLKVYSLI